MQDDVTRFWSQVQVGSEDECWPWAGHINGRYGKCSAGAYKGKLAHRVAWELTNGPVPEGAFLKRTCENDLCCNVKHMNLQLNDFWSHVDVKGEDDCWLWQGATSPNGFGVTGTKAKHYTAHVYAWYLEHGEFPKKQLQHTCGNKLCVNVRHLKIRQAPSDEERFWSMVDRRGDDECWMWKGKIKADMGAGIIVLSDGRRLKAHRYAWELVTGEVLAKEQYLWSKCKVVGCVNPAHYYSGNRDTNERFWELVQKQDEGCWEWQGRVNESGYGLFWHEGKNRLSHRFSWELHNGEIPEGMCVCHKCDVRTCVRPDHLFVGTTQDNTADKMAKGRHRTNPPRGMAAHNAKLTDDDVREIRASVGITQKQLGEKYGVHSSVISEIKTGKRWTHVI